MQSLIRGISDRFLGISQGSTTDSATDQDGTPTDTGGSLPTTIPSAADECSNTLFTTAKTEEQLFPRTTPSIDGQECLHDCDSCSVRLPRKWSIDVDEKLYGHVNAWSTHLIVATGQTDWVRDVTEEPGSVMEAVGRADAPTNGNMMLSASNIPLPHDSLSHQDGTTVLLLPAFRFIDGVTPAVVPELIESCINRAPTNTTPLRPAPTTSLGLGLGANFDSDSGPELGSKPDSLPRGLTVRECSHRYLILLCSQATRDARCGQSAPLLRKEFERHLRPLGLHRDFDDHRPGGAAIYFISHVGGHKFSANVLIYRRDAEVNEAAQCIWLARVRPEDCENIVRYTLLQGKVVKPESQLRGGFDRTRKLISW